MKDLKSHQITQKSNFDNHTGKYSRLNTFFYQQKELCLNEISTGFLLDNLFSSFNSFLINTYFINENEAEKAKNREYFELKYEEYKNIYYQSYCTKVVTSHLSWTVGFLPFADDWSNDFIYDVFIPHVGILSSFFVSAMTLKIDDNQLMKQRITNTIMNSLKINSYQVTKYLYKIINAKSLVEGSHFIWGKIVKVVEFMNAKFQVINNFFCFNIVAAVGSLLATIGISKLLKLINNINNYDKKMKLLKLKRLKAKQKKIKAKQKKIKVSQDKYLPESVKSIAIEEIEENNYWNNCGGQYDCSVGYDCNTGYDCLY